ncbi:MAG: hypothetical protein WD044_15105 [Dongiaceae bacterium]
MTLSIPCNASRSFAFEPASTALLSIDFQRDFVDPAGFCGKFPGGIDATAAIVPRAIRVLEACRAAGRDLGVRMRYLDPTDIAPSSTLYCKRIDQGEIMKKVFTGSSRDEVRKRADHWWTAQADFRKLREWAFATGDDGPHLGNACRWTIVMYYSQSISK